MPRIRRLHLPGAGFHITARTQNGTGYFTPEMRAAITDDIEHATRAFQHTLLAFVVMPNHFHIVLRQGERPLGWLMQRIMQRTVVHVRRAHGGEGHVFGRPYWSCVCGNPGYLRRAIVYTHLNPCKAGLCVMPEDYPWSSHRKYLASARAQLPRQSSHIEGVMLFADRSLEPDQAVHNYQRFIDFCVTQRANQIPGDWLLPNGPNRASMPSAELGDTYWAANYSAFSEADCFTRANVDVSHHATSLLMRIDPNLDLDTIRLAGRSRALSRIRRQLMEGLLVHGCRPTAISRCLSVSPSLVSRVASRMRFPAVCTK